MSYCTAPDQIIVLRIVAAGEILYHEVSCGTLFEAAELGDWDSMAVALHADPEVFEAHGRYVDGEGVLHLGTDYEYEPMYTVGEGEDAEERWTGAVLQFVYGSIEKTNEPICFTGDFFPFYAPSCTLFNSSEVQPTRQHGANEYAIDRNILELKVNDDYQWQVPAEPVVYSIGAVVDVSRDLSETLQGYVDLDLLTEAVPDSITITDLPACGVLTKAGTLVGEQSFAMFWSYSVEEGFVAELALDDVVDLTSETVQFTPSEDCDDLEQ